MDRLFLFKGTPPPGIYPLSLHDALPISGAGASATTEGDMDTPLSIYVLVDALGWEDVKRQDRKSTRLNSSHVSISYAVFCLKKKRKRGCSGSSPPSQTRSWASRSSRTPP